MTTKQTPRTDPLQILPLAEHPECRSDALEIFSYSLPEEEHIFLAKIPEELPPSMHSKEWVIQYESRTVGYIHLLLSGEITYLLYLAIAKDCRGKGIGGRAMDWINRRFAAQFVCFCVETPAEDAPDQKERLARIRFYERFGYQLTGINIANGENQLSLMCRSTAGPEELQNALPFFEELIGIYDKDMISL
ncbi:MAG TPA: GNAT family N-acetyltransferase [Methanocorpusculum sp.]|nr:GNAT family N-acetyltransferase [Methanocorpusculum sp.]HJJ34014.1 GNAT family N-acetyltransferase [Methanocorpusculum sp.]HJJ45188.1 GNAT family N-acetyltransferase [Methanocorpusculum sp.]